MTRMKDNADYGVVEERELPARPGGVRRDEVIFLLQVGAIWAQRLFPAAN